MTQNGEQPNGALAGLRVLDLTAVVLGPYATQTLGDMGADVIKVEPAEGDIMRWVEPTRSRGMGAIFLNSNRNKRSIVLDLKQPAARAALLKIAATSDVFIHSMRKRAIEKLGLAYDDLRAVKDDIIYCAAWGFGSDGPYGGRPAYDDVIQGLSGIADLNRLRSGGEPEFAPTILADKVTGLHAVNAIVTALFHRERTGEGQYVEVPMFEAVTAFNLVEHIMGYAFEPPTGQIGYTRALSPQRRPYKTADGYMAVLPYATRHWISFVKAIGRPELADDPKVSDPTERIRHIGELYGLIAEVMPSRTNAEWAKIFHEADVPAIHINTLEDLRTDPHLEAVGFFPTYEHPSEGTIRTTSVPTHFSKTPGDATRLHPPRLGENTREVLAECGLGADDIDDLIASGAAMDANGG